jgi:hypothetical protein
MGIAQGLQVRTLFERVGDTVTLHIHFEVWLLRADKQRPQRPQRPRARVQNQTETPLTAAIPIKFNKNPLGLQPVVGSVTVSARAANQPAASQPATPSVHGGLTCARTQIDGGVQPGGTGETSVGVTFGGVKDPSTQVGAVQVAIKTELGVAFFISDLPTQLLFQDVRLLHVRLRLDEKAPLMPGPTRTRTGRQARPARVG